MDSTGPHAAQPARDSIESDPAYDYAEDAPVGAAEPDDEELLEEADRLVPLDADDFLGDDQPTPPVDADEFRDAGEE